MRPLGVALADLIIARLCDHALVEKVLQGYEIWAHVVDVSTVAKMAHIKVFQVFLPACSGTSLVSEMRVAKGAQSRRRWIDAVKVAHDVAVPGFESFVDMVLITGRLQDALEDAKDLYDIAHLSICEIEFADERLSMRRNSTTKTDGLLCRGPCC